VDKCWFVIQTITSFRIHLPRVKSFLWVDFEQCGQVVQLNVSRLMLKVLAISLLFGVSSECLHAQNQQSDGCKTSAEFSPVIVRNPSATVTFKCAHATPLDLIRATGRQTRIPIGLVLGLDSSKLENPQRSYDLEGTTAQDALTEAIHGTGYMLREEEGILVLMAGDMTPHQESFLYLHYSSFQPSGTMAQLAADLTGWMWMTTHLAVGYGGSILGSTNDERFSLEEMRSATTKEIANKIVSQGSKGMWILRTAPNETHNPSDYQLEVEPYQHYSNRPNVEF
jgi:hypothetical protein